MNNQALRLPTWDKEARKLKHRCGQAVYAAILSGKIPRLDGSVLCVDCGQAANHYDHRNYYRPLDVEPVCRSCNYLRGQGHPLIKTVRERKMKINFQKLLRDMINRGWTQKELADAAGCGQPNINRLLKEPNIDPRYKVGTKLVALHKKHGP